MPDLHERFEQLATDVDAGSFRDPATIRRRGDIRTRRQVAAATIGTAAVVGAVVAALVAVSGPSDRHHTTPGGGGTPTPSASETPPASASPASNMQSRGPVLVGPVVVTVPEGWHATEVRFDHACVEPVDARPGAFGCAGLDVTWGWNGYLPGKAEVSFSRTDPLWYHALDVQPCPKNPGSGNDYNGIQDEGTLGSEQTAAVGDRTAYTYQWTGAACQSGYTFNPRAWYLPTSQVVMFDYIGRDDIDPIVQDVRFDDGAWKLGYLSDPTEDSDGTHVGFDDVEWLSGKDAADYRQAHGEDPRDIPNDYVLVNDDVASVHLPFADNVRVISTYALAGGEPTFEQRRVSLQRLLEFVTDSANTTAVFHLHLNAAGQIDEVVEQYRP
jgi:hypothetical protein